MNPRILVVDDSLTVRMSLKETLATAGLEAALAASLAEARATLAAGAFELVLLDLLLPDGDGLELLKEIRANAATSHIAVMLLSTEAQVADRIRGLRTGADEYVGKPYDPSFLLARAQELLLSRQPPAGPGELILLIDDSVTFREALKDQLTVAGYSVLTADSGEEGLRTAAARRPAVIIIDGVLPGADGVSVIRRIRLDAALRSTPCLLMTGSEELDAELRAFDAGADAFLRKSEDIAIVLARLAAILRAAAARPDQEGAASLHGAKRLLAVEAEQDLREIAESLRAGGYDVATSCRCDEALELLAVQPADCVILGLSVPGAEEACRRIKSAPKLRDTPVVLLTAPADDRDAIIRGLAAGADDCIAKSSDQELLHARILAQLRRRRFEEENRVVLEALLRRELAAAEARAARDVAEARANMVEELERKNRELDAFSYSVSHDLRAPLRSIDGFSQALLEDYAAVLDETGQDYLRRVRNAAQRMGHLVDDLLQLSRLGRTALRRQRVDLSAIARAIAAELRAASPLPVIRLTVADGLVADGDPGLLRVVLENLLGNAWKFSSVAAAPAVEFGAIRNGRQPTFFIRDNGAGFDMDYADRLFAPFQRLHNEAAFPGTGIGLATVQRIIDRHGGRVWAQGAVGKGASFFWTLPDASRERSP